MRDKGSRGFGPGLGTHYHNDPEAHYRKLDEEKKETIARERLNEQTDIYEAIVLSDRGGEFDGTYDRVIQTNASGKTTYVSVFIRLIGRPGEYTENPDQPNLDPLDQVTKSDFLKIRSVNRTRAVIEKGGWFGSGDPQIGTVVRVQLVDNIWRIVEQYERTHDRWVIFINNLVRGGGAGAGGGAQSMFKKTGNGCSGCCCNGSSFHPSSNYEDSNAGGGQTWSEAQNSQQSERATSKAPNSVSNPASNCDIPIEGRALLDIIAAKESGGSYNVLYGGETFDNYDDHPNKKVPITRGDNTGNVSTGAGRYQFLNRTWKDQKNKLGLEDFSPESQDAAAWNLAKENYSARTKSEAYPNGRDLTADLKNGQPEDLNRVANALGTTWTSLPGSNTNEQLISESAFTEGYGNMLENQKKISGQDGGGACAPGPLG